MTQRDTFISELFEIAKKDKDVILISVDMGASALDRWREELPEQFIWTGISEQHSINLAAGLSASGKKVYVYTFVIKNHNHHFLDIYPHEEPYLMYMKNNIYI